MDREAIFALDDVCEDGCYMKNDLHRVPKLDFDLRAAAKHIKENNIGQITDEVKEKFKL